MSTQPNGRAVRTTGGSGRQGVSRVGDAAIAALALGVLGLFFPVVFIFGSASIAALALGYLAKARMDGSGGPRWTGGVALAAVMVGWVGVVGSAFFIGWLAANLCFFTCPSTTNWTTPSLAGGIALVVAAVVHRALWRRRSRDGGQGSQESKPLR